MQDEKQSYKDVLRAEVEEFIASTNEALEFDELFEFAYAVALRSWKNGLAAGQKRASRGSGNRRYQKGAPREAKSALQAGRLVATQ